MLDVNLCNRRLTSMAQRRGRCRQPMRRPVALGLFLLPGCRTHARKPICPLPFGQSAPLHGTWQRRPRGGFSEHSTCLDGSKRGAPAIFLPNNCTLRRLPARALRGRVMLIGDSLMQYQFDALLAWQRRSGLPLRCRPFKQPSLISDVPRSDDAKNTRATRRRAAVRELLTKSRYDGEPQDCSRPGLQLMVRRLNLLPADDAELDHALNVLLAPLGERGVAVLNVGLWYGPLARHSAFSVNGGGSHAEQRSVAAALAFLHSSVESLVRAACARSGWPKLLWREHTPQHFGSGGEYNASSSAASAGCRSLSQREARTMHNKLSAPALRTFRHAHEQSGQCKQRIGVLPAFWPLVPRHADHEGFRSRRGARADCTHFLPCSGSMMFLNQMLVHGVVDATARQSASAAELPQQDARRSRRRAARRRQHTSS